MKKYINILFIIICTSLCLTSCAYKEYSMRDIEREAKRYSKSVKLIDTIEVNKNPKEYNYIYKDTKEQIEFTVFERHSNILIDGSSFGYKNTITSNYQMTLTNKYLNQYTGSITGKLDIYDNQAYLLYKYNSRQDVEDAISESETILQYLKQCNKNTSLKIAYTSNDLVQYRKPSYYTPNEIRKKLIHDAIFYHDDILNEYTTDEINKFLKQSDERVSIKINNKWVETNYLADDHGTSIQYDYDKHKSIEYKYATMPTKSFIKMVEEYNYTTKRLDNVLYVYDTNLNVTGFYKFNDLSDAEIFIYNKVPCCGLDITIRKW